MLDLAKRITEAAATDQRTVLDADELAERVIALHTWLRRGGFLPARWSRRSDQNALDSIAEILSGKDWSPDDLDAIAAVVRLTGRQIEEPQ